MVTLVPIALATRHCQSRTQIPDYRPHSMPTKSVYQRQEIRLTVRAHSPSNPLHHILLLQISLTIRLHLHRIIPYHTRHLTTLNAQLRLPHDLGIGTAPTHKDELGTLAVLVVANGDADVAEDGFVVGELRGEFGEATSACGGDGELVGASVGGVAEC